jgi:hypothetical protein
MNVLRMPDPLGDAIKAAVLKDAINTQAREVLEQLAKWREEKAFAPNGL